MSSARSPVARARQHAPTVLWLVLMAATGVSLVSSESDRLSAGSASMLIMLLAYGKARLLLLYFMRVCDAPAAWRVMFEAWLLAITGMIVVYALAG